MHWSKEITQRAADCTMQHTRFTHADSCCYFKLLAGQTRIEYTRGSSEPFLAHRLEVVNSMSFITVTWSALSRFPIHSISVQETCKRRNTKFMSILPEVDSSGSSSSRICYAPCLTTPENSNPQYELVGRMTPLIPIYLYICNFLIWIWPGQGAKSTCFQNSYFPSVGALLITSTIASVPKYFLSNQLSSFHTPSNTVLSYTLGSWHHQSIDIRSCKALVSLRVQI